MTIMKGKLNLFIMLGLILGILGGLFFPEVMNHTSFLGNVYINLLKFMIIPIIFTTIMVTIYKTKKENNKMIIKALVTFITMFVATFLLTTIIVLLFNIGNYNYIIEAGEAEIISLNAGEIITNLFPDNIITMIANNSVFACIILALCSGIAASKVDHGKNVIDFVTGLKNISNKLLEWIMYLTPIGVFSLVGVATANYGSAIIGLAAKYIGIAYLSSILTLFFIMILPVWAFNKISPIEYIKRMWKLWILTTSTCSSLATLPETIKTSKEEFKISEKNADLLVPVGCTIHKCGGAVSFAILSIFCCKLFGIEITLTAYFLMLAGAILINMAAPGIPSGGIVLGATYLSMLNIPLIFIGIYSGIYRLLDMSYTTLNVTGNVTANILINKEK